MTRPRLEPRINIRFSSLQKMDEVELFANQNGYNLQDWMRLLVEREMTLGLSKKLIVKDMCRKIDKLEFMFEQLADDAVVRSANERADKLAENFDIHLELGLWTG